MPNIDRKAEDFRSVVLKYTDRLRGCAGLDVFEAREFLCKAAEALDALEDDPAWIRVMGRVETANGTGKHRPIFCTPCKVFHAGTCPKADRAW
jgi:hypothetical protein